MLNLFVLLFWSLMELHINTGSNISTYTDAACTTIYYPHWNTSLRNSHYIETYIWNNTHKLLFRVISPNKQIIFPLIAIKSNDTEYLLRYLYTNNTQNTLELKATFRKIKSNILLPTTPKSIDGVPYDSFMWISWDLYHTNHAFAYFRGGVGTIFDNLSSRHYEGYPLKPNNIEAAYFYDYNEIMGTKWEFYHDLCYFQIDLYIVSQKNVVENRLFSIHDYIHLNPTLLQANALNIPIYISSDDILDVNHSLFINESKQCMMCDRRSFNIPCTDCTEGIRISHLATYAIASNRYTITIYSADDHKHMLSNGETTFEFVRKIQNVSIQTNDSVNVDGYIAVYIRIENDDDTYQPHSVIHVYNHIFGVDHNIYLFYNNQSQNCTVISRITSITETCHKGVGPIHVNNGSDTDLNQFTLYLSSNDTYLVRNEISIVLESAYVAYNEWMVSVSEDISSICPNDKCCQDINGCHYTNDDELVSTGYLCAYNRNHTVALCGSCIAGYSEVFNAPYCKQCDTDHYEYLGLPILVAFIVIFILILFDTTMYKPHNISPSQQRHIALMAQDEAEGILIVIFRIFIVFYQCINYILWQAGYTFWGSTMIQILSLDSYIWFLLSSDSDVDDGVCFLSNLTAMQYHIWYLYFPLCLILVLFLFILMKQTCCKSALGRITGAKPCEFGGYTTWNLAVIILFPVLITCVILLSCHYLNDEYGTVHFYAANTKCYGTEFVVAAFMTTVIVLFVICIWFHIKRMNPSKYNSAFWKDNASCLRGIARPYKAQYWYFEFIIIIRKIVIVTCITLQYVHRMAMHIVVLIVFLLIACLELKCDPFKYKRVMYMDLVCSAAILVSLVIMMVNINNNFFHQEQTAKDNSYIFTNGIGDVSHLNVSHMNANQIATVACLSITIIIPIVLLLWYIIYAIWSCCSMRNSVQESNAAMKRRIARMKERLEWIGCDDKISSPLCVQRVPDTDAEEAEAAELSRKGTTTLTMILNAENEDTYFTKTSKRSFDDDDVTTTVFETMDDYSVTESNTFSTQNHAHTEMISLVPAAARNTQKKSRVKRESTLKKLDEDIEIDPSESKSFKRKTNVSRLERSENEESHTAISSVYEDTFSSRHTHEVVQEPKKVTKVDKYQSIDSDVTDSDHEEESNSDSEGDDINDSEEDMTRVDAVDHNKMDDNDDDESQIALNPASATRETPQMKEHQTPFETETQTQGKVNDDTDSDPDGDLTLILEEMVVQIVKDTPGNNSTVDSKSSEPLLAPIHATTTDSEQEEKTHDDDTDSSDTYASDEGDTSAIPLPMLLENNTSITLSVPSESVQVFHASKSHRNDNQFDIDNQYGYKYEYQYHSQDVIKNKIPLLTEDTKQNENADHDANKNKRKVPKAPKQSFKRVTKLTLDPPAAAKLRIQNIKKEVSGNAMSPQVNQSFLRQHTATYSIGSRSRASKFEFQRTKAKNVKRQSIKEESKTETPSDTSSEYESRFSYTSSVVDAEKEKKSWILYGDNLKKIFVCFAGCQSQFEETKQEESVFMSFKRIKKFLDIISITKYWTMQQVLDVMHRENENNLESLGVTMDEFVQYFCNEAVNPKVKDIKKHIEKQVSWKWMLKSLLMFEQIDVKKRGYLNIDQFSQYAKSYNWDRKKADTLFHKIDSNKSGQITIMQLLDWFWEGFKAAKQRNKAKYTKQTSNATWSGSHSSFYDDSIDTQSVTTYHTEDSPEEW